MRKLVMNNTIGLVIVQNVVLVVKLDTNNTIVGMVVNVLSVAKSVRTYMTGMVANVLNAAKQEIISMIYQKIANNVAFVERGHN
ncbi:MAG: hypothetical protein JZU47_02925 [Prolixibacteraceae bacterium]|nr:hypothetical protein [Prolixibacteraceae bacterium]